MSDYKTELKKIIEDAGLAPAIAKLKQVFNMQPAVNPPAAPAPVVQAVDPAAAPASPVQESVLADGTPIKYNTPTLAVGSEVTVVGPEGEMPAPEGEHKLQDGSTIKVVSKEGKSVVESITPAAAPQNPAIPQLQAQMKALEDKFNAVVKEKETFSNQNKALSAEVSELKKNVSEFFNVFQAVLDLPSGTPTETPRNKFAIGVDKKADILTKFNSKK